MEKKTICRNCKRKIVTCEVCEAWTHESNHHIECDLKAQPQRRKK